jgi:hypothetical protein
MKIVLGASSTLIADSLEPESNQGEECADFNTVNDDSLEQVLEGLSPGHLDTDGTIPVHIPNGLSNPDKLPNDADIINDLINDPDLQRLCGDLHWLCRRHSQGHCTVLFNSSTGE